MRTIRSSLGFPQTNAGCGHTGIWATHGHPLYQSQGVILPEHQSPPGVCSGLPFSQGSIFNRAFIPTLNSKLLQVIPILETNCRT
jgi:hypothetical protein